VIRCIDFLSRHRTLNILIVLIVYLLVTLPHEFVGVTIAGIFKGVPRSQYDFTILSIGIVIFLVVAVYLLLQLKKLKSIKIPMAFFIFCLICMVLSLNILIIVNIEIIHFIQYALLSILIFPLVKSFFGTIVLITLLGTIDEAYQYYFLSPDRTNYYDFNDVILNLLGGAMGMIFLRSHLGISSFLSNLKKTHRYTWSTYFAFVLCMIMLLWQKSLVQKGIDLLGLPLDWEGYGAVLIRKPTVSFWTEIPPKILYHVVQPLEGLCLVTILLFVFSFLYKESE